MENYTQEKEVTEEKSIDVDKIESVFIEKTQSLLGNYNDSFQGLCKTLEAEQMKLAELEKRRARLQEEMQKLRLEIENEKRLFEEDVASVTQQRTLENNLPDPVDVTKLDIEVKTDFMREFLTQQSRELKDLVSRDSSELLDSVERIEEVAEPTDNDESDN